MKRQLSPQQMKKLEQLNEQEAFSKKYFNREDLKCLKQIKNNRIDLGENPFIQNNDPQRSISDYLPSDIGDSQQSITLNDMCNELQRKTKETHCNSRNGICLHHIHQKKDRQFYQNILNNPKYSLGDLKEYFNKKSQTLKQETSPCTQSRLNSQKTSDSKIFQEQVITIRTKKLITPEIFNYLKKLGEVEISFQTQTCNTASTQTQQTHTTHPNTSRNFNLIKSGTKNRKK